MCRSRDSAAMACTDIDRQDQMDVAMFRQLLGQLSAAYESLHGRVEQYREQELNSKWACKEMIASRISREAPLDVGLALRVSFAPADYAPLMKKPSVRRVSSTSYTVSAEQQRSSTGFQGTSIRASVVKKKNGRSQRSLLGEPRLVPDGEAKATADAAVLGGRCPRLVRPLRRLFRRGTTAGD